MAVNNNQYQLWVSLGWRFGGFLGVVFSLWGGGWPVGRPGRGSQGGAATSLGSGAPPGALGPLRGPPSLQLAGPHCQPRPGLTAAACVRSAARHCTLVVDGDAARWVSDTPCGTPAYLDRKSGG